MSHVVMLLSNPFRPDPRVLKEMESLAQMGYQVTVLCWDRAAEFPAEEILSCGGKVIRLQRVPSRYGIGAGQLLPLVRFWRTTLSCLKNLKPDLLHCHDFDTLPPGLLWAGIHRIPVIYDAHEYYADLIKPRLRNLPGKWLYNLVTWMDKLGARLASAVITVDETLAQRYRRHNHRVLVIGHFPPRSQAAQPSQAFSRQEDLTLIYVGRLSIDRGLLIYLDILRGLQQAGIQARLRLAGVFTPASEEKLFREHCQGLEKSVEMIGWIPYAQVPDLLRNADIGLAILLPEPRYVAALPVKLFEYMAAGLPIIASRFPSIEQILKNADCGALIDPSNPQEAVDHILHWFRQPQLARLAGERGRQAILSRYNWESYNASLSSLYQSLLIRKE